MTAQPRERACPCQMCGAEISAPSAVCDRCMAASYAGATTREQRAAEIRNAGVREALAILKWFPPEARVEMATRILLDSCHKQERLLP